MRGLHIFCFIILLKQSFSHVIFPDVLETAIRNLRSKREEPCGGEVDVSDGTGAIQLRTEDFNGTEMYRGNEECLWTVKTKPNHYIILKSEYFSVEQSDDCVWDYVNITDGDTSSRYCGWNPMSYITSSHEITLQFKSDVSYEDRGFKFTVESKQRNDEVSKCDSSIIGGDDSRIMNNDAEGKGCLYRIQATGDKVIELDLKMLNFGSASCDEESIVVYEGLSTRGDPLGTICSDSVPGILQFHVRMVFIEYRNQLSQEGERFMIEYSFVEDNFTPAPVPPTTPSPVGGNNDCSGMYKGSSLENGEMIFTAPEYQNDKHCIVVVRNDILPKHEVQMRFLYFDLEDSDDCIFDSLRMKSGERADSVELGGPYCGESLRGRTFFTNGNSLRLEFKTDVSFALRGFKVAISFVPTSDCTCEGNQICIRQDNEKKCIRGQHCMANMCQNGGTCVQTGSSQTCYCRAGFQGEDCSQSVGGLSYHLHFTKAPQDRALKKNEGHIEECVVEAPKGENVQYDWTFDGALIQAYNRKSGYGVHPGGVLEIDKFTEGLEGQYSCFATTSAGTAEHTFEYRLVEDCDVSIFPGPQSETKKVHENALFICRVDSRAKEVRWKKDGVYIDFDNNARFRKIVSTYLAISDVRMEDAGLYQCEAEDTNGCFSYKEGRLTVINVKHISKYCGQSIHDQVLLASSRISKGYKARPNENPWHVTFRSIGDSSKQRAFCGGTLITQSYILTAAHCIKEFEKNFHAPFAPNNVQFLLGTVNCLGDDGSGTIRTFKNFTVHPDFGKRAPYDNDIALIELDGRVEYTDSISPICLEPDEYNDRVFLENSVSLSPVPGKVAGCGELRKDGGAVRFLQEIHLPYVNNEDCLESFKSSSNLFTDRMFCAGSNIARTGDTCQGDSGGGYVMATSSRWVQTGIVSWGMGGCDVSRFYGIYTKVGPFYDWIDGITKFSEEEVPNFLNQF